MMCRYPFDTKKYKIIEAQPQGEYAHSNYPESRFAVDFILPLKTPVLAVKEGIIIAAKHDSEKHYNPIQLNMSTDEMREVGIKSLNIVGIDHGNGAITEYAHLSTKKVVSVGQKINEGQIIGYTGRSGLMDADHLHFNAFTKENDVVRSIPVEFME